jgi:NitT/TauT family transport system substrate-binding protein
MTLPEPPSVPRKPDAPAGAAASLTAAPDVSAAAATTACPARARGANALLQRAASRFGLGGGLAALALVLALSAAAYWRFAATANDSRPAALAPMTICLSLQAGVLVSLAHTQGEFARAGLAVTLTPFPTGRDALAGMLDGKCEIATSAETPIVLAAFEQSNLRILTSTTSNRNVDRIVTRKQSRIRGPNDLLGRRVGIIRGTSSAYFLDRLLVANNIDGDTVTVVELESPAALTAALVRGGEVDAVAIWQPLNQAIMRRLGDDAAEFSAPGVHSQTTNLATRLSVIDQRSADLRALLRALLRAEANALNDPERAKAALAAALGLDKTATDELWASAGQFRVGLSQAFLLQLEDEARWAVSDRLAHASMRPNFLDVVATEPLLAVAPERVTIYRMAHDDRR